MKELKNIVLKKGDIIYFDDGDRHIISFDLYNNTLDGLDKTGDYRVIKIERPVKYETIYEAPKQILDKEEKEYLEHVIGPFKKRVRAIVKFNVFSNYVLMIKVEHKEYECESNDYIQLLKFAKDIVYEGMELNKEYTLKELGLFE